MGDVGLGGDGPPAPAGVDPGTAYANRRDELIAGGLLVPAGTDGLYARSATFEAIVEGIEALASAAGGDQGGTVLRFPPVVAQDTFLASGYLRSFPDLVGAVATFQGSDRDHAALLASLEDGGDWMAHLVGGGVALCSAACHPLYPTLVSPLPPGGSRYDVYGWVFRHEPSLDPARMQAFRQYEHVYVGDPAGALAHRDLWRDRAAGLMADLGLDVTVEVANDPFFGRMGRMLTRNQQEAELKYEVLAPTSGAPRLTAICSANCHEDHFGESFDIRTSDGSPAHSACVGFGVERITLALLWRHGLDLRAWPAAVRGRLGL